MNKRILAIAAVLVGGGFLVGFSTRTDHAAAPVLRGCSHSPRALSRTRVSWRPRTSLVTSRFAIRTAPVSRGDVAGRIYVASFFYTECRTLCPDLKAQLARVHETFSGDTGVVILTHTVAPADDDVARLAHYAKLNGIDHRQWRLLTGSLGEIERLARERYSWSSPTPRAIRWETSAYRDARARRRRWTHPGSVRRLARVRGEPTDRRHSHASLNEQELNVVSPNAASALAIALQVGKSIRQAKQTGSG